PGRRGLARCDLSPLPLHDGHPMNNESTCTATFTVTDNIPPVITTCASNQSALADGLCQAPVPDFTTNGLVAADCNGSAPLQITQARAAARLDGRRVTHATLDVSVA